MGFKASPELMSKPTGCPPLFLYSSRSFTRESRGSYPLFDAEKQINYNILYKNFYKQILK